MSWNILPEKRFHYFHKIRFPAISYYLFVFSVHWENRKVRAEFDTGRWFYVSEK